MRLSLQRMTKFGRPLIEAADELAMTGAPPLLKSANIGTWETSQTGRASLRVLALERPDNSDEHQPTCPHHRNAMRSFTSPVNAMR